MNTFDRIRHSSVYPVIAVLGPPVVWSGHLLICYLLVTATTIAGTTGVRIEIGIATAIALSLILLCALVALDEPGASGHRPFTDEPGIDLPGFVRDLGLATALLFAIATIFTLIPAIALERF